MIEELRREQLTNEEGFTYILLFDKDNKIVAVSSGELNNLKING